MARLGRSYAAHPLYGLPPAFTAVLAPTSALTDDFATQDTAKWTYPSGAAASGGQLVLNCTSTYTENLSVNAYRLSESSAFVQLVSVPTALTAETYLNLYLDAGNPNLNNVYYYVNGPEISAFRTVNGTATKFAIIPYDSAVHKWLRIRETGGTVYWDYAPDGINWVNQTSWVHTFSTGSVYQLLGTGYFGTESTPGTAVFDNVNIVPATSVSATVTAPAASALTVGAGPVSGAVPLPAASTLTVGAPTRTQPGAVTAAASSGMTLGAATVGTAVTPAASSAMTLGAAPGGPPVPAPAAAALAGQAPTRPQPGPVAAGDA